MINITKTGYALLGMLTISPMSGYDMRQLMQTSTANFWSESDGQLYPALTKLTKAGLAAILPTNNHDRRGKKIYEITAKGREALIDWLQTEPETFSVRNEFMLKLFFSANIDKSVSLARAEAARLQTKMALTELQATKNKITKDDKDSPHYVYWLLSLDYGIKMTQAKLSWHELVIRELNKN